MMKGTASSRKPATPSASQKPMIRRISSRTAGFVHVQVRLKVVEAVEVVLPHVLRVCPGPSSGRRGRPSRTSSSGAASSPRRTSRGTARRSSAAPPEPRMAVGGVVDHEIHDDADPTAPRLVQELDEVARASRGAGRRRSSRKCRSRCRGSGSAGKGRARPRRRRGSGDSRVVGSAPRSRRSRRRSSPGTSPGRGCRRSCSGTRGQDACLSCTARRPLPTAIEHVAEVIVDRSL